MLTTPHGGQIGAVQPFCFGIEPLSGPPSSAGEFLGDLPEAEGNGRWCHNAHLDRTVLDAQAGEVLVHKRQQYHVLPLLWRVPTDYASLLRRQRHRIAPPLEIARRALALAG